MIRAVLDTNVLVAALRSSSGASHQILLAADRGDFEVALSVPVLAEYDDVLVRPTSGISIPRQAVEAIVGRIAQISHKQPIYFVEFECDLRTELLIGKAKPEERPMSMWSSLDLIATARE